MPRSSLSAPRHARRPDARRGFARRVLLSVVALTTVAISQPLLDLLGRNAAFLVAHDLGALDVVVLAIGLAIALPLVLAAVVLLLARVHPRLGAAAHLLVIGGLVTVLALVVFRRSGASLPAASTLTRAAAIGFVGAVAYARIDAIRRMVAWAAVAAPVVVLLFLFATPARSVVLPGAAAPGGVDLGPDAPPVVVAIFDEFPVASLLAEDRSLDEENFPAFGRLARDGLFFRNMTTVHQQTSDAIPAALTGRYGNPDELLPLAADHPNNLIALLADEYDLHVLEPITELCPRTACGDTAKPAPTRYSALLRDLQVVTLHVVLPPQWAAQLPSIDQGWGDFRREAATAGKEAAVAQRFKDVRATDQETLFQRYLDEIERTNDPVLHLVHMMLPHSPWRYLPDGRSYTDQGDRPGMVSGVWQADEWRVAHNYQRHLVQTQMVDRMLGDLIERLEEQGLYDEALVVVMADHGISFTPKAPLRVMRPGTFGEIGAVPFFVKRPGQTNGAVSDAPLELVDILPTILDAIGAEPPSGIDGRSAFGSAPARTMKTYHVAGGVLEFPPGGDEKWPVVDRRARLFGHDGPFGFPYDIAPRDLHRLLGRRVADAGKPLAGVTATIDNAARYRDVDLSVDASPLLVTGVVASSGATVPEVVAIAVNDRIAAVVEVDPDPLAPRAFRALLPPDVLRPGENDLAVYAVDGAGSLVPLRGAP